MKTLLYSTEIFKIIYPPQICIERHGRRKGIFHCHIVFFTSSGSASPNGKLKRRLPGIVNKTMLPNGSRIGITVYVSIARVPSCKIKEIRIFKVTGR